jgi:hypothetical protein
VWRERAAVVAVAALVAATILDAVIALKWLGSGREPGDSTLTEDVAGALAFVGFVLGLIAALQPPRAWAVVALPAAAAGWMTVHYYTFDPYFYPDRLRFSEFGSVAAWWLYAVAVCGVAVAAAAWRWASAARLVWVFLVVCGFTTVAEGIGH